MGRALLVGSFFLKLVEELLVAILVALPDTPLDSRVYLAVRGGEGQEQFIKDFWSHIKGNLEYEH